MKKLVIFFIAGMICADGLFANVEEKTSSMPDLIISIIFNLHSRASACKKDFGFCKIELTISWEPGTNNPTGTGIPGQISLDANNQLIIKIAETDLLKYENGGSLKYLKGKQTIYVDENYDLNRDVCSSLGASKTLIIKQGEYKVKFDGTMYTIIIPQ